MTARKTPLSDQLSALGDVLVAAKQRERECELAHRRAEADVARLRDAVIDAHADGDEQRAAKASRERDKAEAELLRDSEARLEGAKRAVAKAEAERGLFAVENLNGLLSERRPAAQAAAREAEQAVGRLVQAHAAWTSVEQDVAGLLRLAGRDTRDLARFPTDLEELVRQAKRVDATEVPLPLPTGAPTAVVGEAA